MICQTIAARRTPAGEQELLPVISPGIAVRLDAGGKAWVDVGNVAVLVDRALLDSEDASSTGASTFLIERASVEVFHAQAAGGASSYTLVPERDNFQAALLLIDAGRGASTYVRVQKPIFGSVLSCFLPSPAHDDADEVSLIVVQKNHMVLAQRIVELPPPEASMDWEAPRVTCCIRYMYRRRTHDRDQLHSSQMAASTLCT